jgi:peptidoglycan hydrolase CwlO-like protein
MRKIVIVMFFAAFNIGIQAQTTSVMLVPATDSSNRANDTLEERLRKQEATILSLQRENQGLKKEVKHIKASLPITQRKFSISRRGSKQVVVE